MLLYRLLPVTSIGSIRSLTLEVDNSSSDGSLSLLARTVGGPPDGRWTRDGQVIEIGHPSVTITYTLDTSLPTFYNLAPFISRLHIHSRYPGLYVYTVTNRMTEGVFRKSISIDGM